MQLIQDFRLRCFKANGLAERVDEGLRSEDDWFSVKNLATIEAVRMVIKDQVQQVDRTEVSSDREVKEDRGELVLTIEVGEVKIELEVADKDEPMATEIEPVEAEEDSNVAEDSAEDDASDASKSPTTMIPHQCLKCDRVFCNSRAIKLHSLKCVEQPVTGILFTCYICSASFRNRAPYLVHLNNHGGKTPNKCLFCNRAFACPKTCKTHEYNCGKYMVDCTLCHKSLPNNQQLMDHYRKVHPGERMHQCSQCDERFTARYSLNMHVSRQHEKHLNTFSCSVCDKTFARERELRWHLKCHSRQMPNPCEFCDERFCSKELLVTHVARVHPVFASDEDLQELANKQKVMDKVKTMLMKRRDSVEKQS